MSPTKTKMMNYDYIETSILHHVEMPESELQNFDQTMVFELKDSQETTSVECPIERKAKTLRDNSSIISKSNFLEITNSEFQFQTSFDRDSHAMYVQTLQQGLHLRNCNFEEEFEREQLEMQNRRKVKYLRTVVEKVKVSECHE